jgi:hypothetical protein
MAKMTQINVTKLPGFEKKISRWAQIKFTGVGRHLSFFIGEPRCCFGKRKNSQPGF